jgi:hypothetical protein
MAALARWAIVGTLLATSADPADRVVQGELVRVDVGKRTLVVRPVGTSPREVEVTVDTATLITASGRTLGLEDLKTGERVMASCTVVGDGPCRAGRVRAGPGRYAAPPAPRVRPL